MKCAQMGVLHTVSASELYNEDIDLVGITDLINGASLCMVLDKKMYPVTYLKGKCSNIFLTPLICKLHSI